MLLPYLLKYLLWIDGNLLRPALGPASQFDDLREQVCGAKEHIGLAIAQYLEDMGNKQKVTCCSYGVSGSERHHRCDVGVPTICARHIWTCWIKEPLDGMEHHSALTFPKSATYTYTST